MNRRRPTRSDYETALAYVLGLDAAPHPRFAFRDFGRWQTKVRAHETWGDRVRVEAVRDGDPVDAVLIGPGLPSRRRSASLARFARLDP